MILTDQQIRSRINQGAGAIAMVPYDPRQVQPSSYDLRLGPQLMIDTPDGFRLHCLDDDGPFTMYPDFCILGATLENIGIPDDVVGVISGKSTLARQFLSIEDAGYVDPGWNGHLTLELVKRGFRPITLYIGMPICQIRFHALPQYVERPYGHAGLSSHYQHARGPMVAYPETNRRIFLTPSKTTRGAADGMGAAAPTNVTG